MQEKICGEKSTVGKCKKVGTVLDGGKGDTREDTRRDQRTVQLVENVFNCGEKKPPRSGYNSVRRWRNYRGKKLLTNYK